MRFVFLLASFLFILGSCSRECPKCSNVNAIATNEPIPVDVPKNDEQVLGYGPPTSFTVKVMTDDRYIIDGKEIEFESIEGYIEDLRINDPNFNDIIRIEGDKNARYEAVFKLMALADQMNLKPALAYKK